MVSLFPSHWRNSKKKSPCGPSRPAGTCKGTGAASILPCKKQEPSEMVRIRLTFAAGILTGAKKRPRRGRISGCLRSRWPARSTVCRGKNTSRRSGDFSGDAEHRLQGDVGQARQSLGSIQEGNESDCPAFLYNVNFFLSWEAINSPDLCGNSKQQRL